MPFSVISHVLDSRTMTSSLLFGVVATPLVALVISYARMLSLRQQLPPGPFPFPIIGNHLQIPMPKPWIAFEKWSEYYNSPLITIWIGRRPKIVVNDVWVAHELMEKRANIYSDRPRNVIQGDLLDATRNNQTYLPYGDRWRAHRKLMVSGRTRSKGDATRGVC